MKPAMMTRALAAVLSVCTLGAATIAPAAEPPAGKAAADERNVDVEQVFRDRVEGVVVLEFAVGAVSLNEPGPFTMEEATNRSRVQQADGTYTVSRLRVALAKPVEGRLKQLGVQDLAKHFYGQRVRVRGELKRDVVAGDGGNSLITYTLTVNKLEQLESVSPPTK